MTSSQELNGDGSGFEALYRQYAERLLGSLTRTTRNRDQAEEIAAAAFKTAFEKRASFRGESSFYTWLHAIALNELRNAWRQREPVSLDDGGADKVCAQSDDISRSLERSENRERLHKALSQVPEKFRKPLVDHVVHEVPTRQIARQEGLPLGTVLTRIFAGKRLLRRAWKAVT